MRSRIILPATAFALAISAPALMLVWWLVGVSAAPRRPILVIGLGAAITTMPAHVFACLLSSTVGPQGGAPA